MRIHPLFGGQRPNKDAPGPAYSSTQPSSTLPWGATVEDRWIIKGLLIAYLGSVVAALLVVFPQDWLNQDPDLPHVKMTISDKAKGSGDDTIEDGLLLALSDGYWHVIDTSSRDRNPSIGKQSFRMIPASDADV